MSTTYELEIEGAQDGIVCFSVKGRPDLDYLYLPGQFCNDAKVLARATITIEGDNEQTLPQ